MTSSDSSPTITGLEKVPRKKEYLLRLSDGSTIRALEEHLPGFGLVEGSEVDEDTLREITASYEYARAREAAMRLLKTRPRTEQELRRRFSRKGFAGKTCDRLIGDLKAEGLIDDRVFARLWIREKVVRAQSGRRRIISDLRAKGIEEAVVLEELRLNYDRDREAENARQVALKRIAKLRNPADGGSRQKTYSFLLRRGFGSDIAQQAVESAMNSPEVKGRQ
jgi:regulatory protein